MWWKRGKRSECTRKRKANEEGKEKRKTEEHDEKEGKKCMTYIKK